MRILLVAALTLAGCHLESLHLKPFGPHHPAEALLTQEPEVVFRKALLAVTVLGLSVREPSSATLIVTEWETLRQGASYRLRWVVSMDMTKSTVTVVSQCQILVGPIKEKRDYEEWERCGTQPKDRNALAKALANAIAH